MQETVTKSQELIFYDIYAKRKQLLDEEKKYYWNLQKGFEGESLFYEYTKEIDGHFLVLTDLLLEFNQTTFQIDCLMITSSTV